MKDRKVLVIKPEKDIFNSEKLVKEIILTVMRGTGLASGVSWISMELILESSSPVEAGGYQLENNHLVLLGGHKPLEGPLADALNAYFLDHPEQVEGLKKELKQ